MSVCLLRRVLGRCSVGLSRRAFSEAAAVKEETAALTSEEDQPEEAQQVVEQEEEEDSAPLLPGTFHTRSLVVHEVFRRFRPPREAWIYGFDNPVKRGLIELHPEVFAVNPRIDKIHEVLHWQEKCTRKEEIEYMRSELPGSGKKLRPQKGTGRARMKDKRAPQFKFGGKVLGKRPRDYGYDIDPITLITGFSAICTAKLAQGDLFIVDSLKDVDVPALAEYKSRLTKAESVLFVTGHGPDLTSSQNTEICFHPGIDLLTTETVHPLAMVQHTVVVMDYLAVRQLEEWVLTIRGEHALVEQTADTPL